MADKRPRTINIIQWNIDGYRQRSEELEILLATNNVHLALLNESRLSPDVQIKIRRYRILRSGGRNSQGGVAVLVRHDLPCAATGKTSLDRQQTISIRTANNTAITAIYNSPRNRLTPEALKGITARKGTKQLIVGDFNAKHRNWGNDYNNVNGTILQNLTDLTNATIQFPDQPTCYPHNNSNPSTIDIIYNRNVPTLRRLTTLEGYTSDHRPVKFELGDLAPELSDQRTYDFATTDWILFRRYINENIILTHDITSPADLDASLHVLTITITNATDRYTKKTKPPNHLSQQIPQTITDLLETRIS